MFHVEQGPGVRGVFHVEHRVLAGGMFHVEHCHLPDPARLGSVGGSQIDSRPAIAVVGRGFADDDHASRPDPRSGQADRGLGGSKSTTRHGVHGTVIVGLSEHGRIPRFHAHTVGQTKAVNRPVQEICSFGSPVNEDDPKLKSGDGNDKSGHPGT